MVKEIIKIIDIVSIMYILYYVLTGILAFTKRKQVRKYKEKNRFGVIIPARDEEKVIGNLLESLKEQNYPKDLFDIYVLPNNCTDNTKEIAIEKNANIIECYLNIKSKGEALAFAFDYLKERDYKAYIIFDADNVVHPNFIKEMNFTLNNGEEIAQGYRDSKNPSDTWISSSYSLHYMIQNTFVNKARRNIIQSCFLNGTGIMISKKVIEEKGYTSKTMTEDIELTIKSAINNEKIAFVENAITYDEQTTTLKDSWKQRKRWSIGTMQCLGIYWKDLLKKRSFASIDSLIFLLAPILQVIGVIVFIVRAIASILSYNLYTYCINQAFTGAFMYIISIGLSILVIKMNNKKVRNYIKGIVMLPIFLLTWLPINMMALLNQKAEWEKIEHTRNIKIDNMLKIEC